MDEKLDIISEMPRECKYCKKLPTYHKVFTIVDGYKYLLFTFKCKCKQTPLRAKLDDAENDWDTIYYRTKPKDMPEIYKIHIIKSLMANKPDQKVKIFNIDSEELKKAKKLLIQL